MFPRKFSAMCDLEIDMVTRFKSNVNLYKLLERITENRRGRSKKYSEAILSNDLMQDEQYKSTRANVYLYSI